MRSSTPSRVVPPGCDAEIVAAECGLVVVEVAQEVHVLERGPEPTGTVDELRRRGDIGCCAPALTNT